MSIQPRFKFDSLIFNNGDTLNLNGPGIIVFVGPNNSGKSALLRDITTTDQYIQTGHRVITATTKSTIGTEEDLKSYLKERGFIRQDIPDDASFNMGNFQTNFSSLKNGWHSKHFSSGLDRVFLKLLNTETRLGYADKVNTIDFSRVAPLHPIHHLFLNQNLEFKASENFRRAFNTDLIVNRVSGAVIPLQIGTRPQLEPGQVEYDPAYIKKLNALTFLETQGDGMRSFASILIELITGDNVILLIDEPEAFLYPSQARQLGRLVRNISGERQIFIATHSSDFIKGLLDNPHDNVSIVRIVRDGSQNIHRVLSNTDIKEFWKDPVLKFSPIIDGLFHENVIVCESDGDCRFFSTLFYSMYQTDPRSHKISDTLFIPAYGKAKIPGIVHALRKLSVPTFSIVDFDIFNNERPLKDLIEAHGGRWQDFEQTWKIFKTAVDQIKSQLEREEVKREINKLLDTSTASSLTIKEIEALRTVLKKSSAWSFAKEQGIDFVPRGDARKKCADTMNLLANIGIFVLPVGELESFDKDISNSYKPAWLEEALERDLFSSDVLASAKKFVKEIAEIIYGTTAN